MIYCNRFIQQEDSATLRSDMSACWSLRETVYRVCTVFFRLPETQCAKPRGPGQSPGNLGIAPADRFP